MNKESLGPLTGVAVAVFVAVALILVGSPPAPDSSAQEVVDFYLDNKDSIVIGSISIGLAVLFFAFFAGYLRAVLRRAEGEGGMLSAVVLVGAAIFAAGPSIDAAIAFGLAQYADDLEPGAVQGLQVIFDANFIPYAVGGASFLIAAGISIIRHGALPKWLGWLGVIAGVAALTPASIIAIPLWILIASVMLALDARTAPAR